MSSQKWGLSVCMCVNQGGRIITETHILHGDSDLPARMFLDIFLDIGYFPTWENFSQNIDLTVQLPYNLPCKLLLDYSHRISPSQFASQPAELHRDLSACLYKYKLKLKFVCTS